jgi:hypothetical protein
MIIEDLPENIILDIDHVTGYKIIGTMNSCSTST